MTILPFQRKAMHWAFYGLLLAATGLLAFHAWDWTGDVHSVAKPALIILIGLHADAARFHHLVLKDDTLRRMLTPALGTIAPNTSLARE